jgi:hypothetical protein
MWAKVKGLAATQSDCVQGRVGDFVMKKPTDIRRLRHSKPYWEGNSVMKVRHKLGNWEITFHLLRSGAFP